MNLFMENRLPNYRKDEFLKIPPDLFYTSFEKGLLWRNWPGKTDYGNEWYQNRLLPGGASLHGMRGTLGRVWEERQEILQPPLQRWLQQQEEALPQGGEDEGGDGFVQESFNPGKAAGRGTDLSPAGRPGSDGVQNRLRLFIP